MLGVQSLWAAIGVVTYVDSGECTFDLSDTVNNDYSTTANASSINHIYFAQSGTLKLTGSGDKALVKSTIVAIGCTVTIDVSGFTFSNPDQKILELGGGIYNENGALVVNGLDRVVIGDTREKPVNAPVNLTDVTLNGAELVFDGMLGIWALPDKKTTGWTITEQALKKQVWLWGEDPLRDLADENGVITWQSVVTMNGDRSVGEGKTLQNTVSAGSLTFYPSQPQTGNAIGGRKYLNYLSRGGKGRVHYGNLRLTKNTNSSYPSLTCSVRGVKMYGSVTGEGTISISSNKSASWNDAYYFFGPVITEGKVLVENASGAGQWIVFSNTCFTAGNEFESTATNAVVYFCKNDSVAPYEPNFTTVTFAAGQPSYGRHTVIEVRAGQTIRLGRILSGRGILRGQGTVKLGGISAGAELFVEPGLTVVKDPAVAGSFRPQKDSDPLDGRDYVTYRFAEPIDLPTYSGENPVTIVGAVDVYGETSAAPSLVLNMTSNSMVNLRTAGDTWNDDDHIISWFDFSDTSTLHQVVAVDPTANGTAGSAALLPPEELGPKSVGLQVIDNRKTDYPAIDKVVDCRGEEFSDTSYFNNDRMYQNLKKTGTNEWWESVYLGMVTNDAASKRPYLSAGLETKSTSRRLLTPTTSYASDLKTVTVVFGSQNGGGAGVLSDVPTTAGGLPDGFRLFGRAKGGDNPILSNDTCRVWLNGEEVDPTTTPFSGGWDIITFEIKDDYYKKIVLRGIGYSTAYSGTGVADGGGQNYGEMLLFNSALTDDERKLLESRLAEKWGIDYAAPVVRQAKLTGAGAVSVGSRYVLTVDGFGGMIDILGDGEVTLNGNAATTTITGAGRLIVPSRSAMPIIDPGFTGEIIGPPKTGMMLILR